MAKKKPATELTPEELARKAQQSKTGKSNVRRSKSHERTIAKFLTVWSGQEFRRRRVEGRDVTVIERESTADVIPVKGDVHFSIEAKCGAVQSFGALMENPRGTKFTEWWHQANYDCKLVAKVFDRAFYPMMFFRPYPNQNWVAVSERAFRDNVLKDRQGAALWPVNFPHLRFDEYERMGDISFNVVRTSNKQNYRFEPLHLHGVVMCRWQDFAKHVDPASFFLSPIPTPPPASQNYGEEGGDGVRVLPEGSDTEGGEGS